MDTAFGIDVGVVETDAFGLVAMVAMTPLLTIQVLGIIYQMKINRTAAEPAAVPEQTIEIFEFDWRVTDGTN